MPCLFLEISGPSSAACSHQCCDHVQERDQTLEAQLAETTNQLHNLRLKQRELEARNSLLEKVAALNRQQSLHEDARGNGEGHTGSSSKSQVLHFLLPAQQVSGRCKHAQRPLQRLWKLGSMLGLLLQADVREVFVKILERAGLRRSHGGAALVLTGRDSEENFKIDDIAAMSLPDLAKLYTVCCNICYVDNVHIIKA